MTTKKMPKNAEIFICEICDFKCCKLSNYTKHLLTSKHLKTTIRLQNTTKKNAESSEKMPKMPRIYYCNCCEKQYNHHSSLWKHKKTCTSENKKNNDENELKMLTNLILDVVKSNSDIIKSNSDLQKQVLEISKDNNNNNTFISNNNSHNKTFNLNLFLNETCKDAMNITDFVESVKIKLIDLENVGRLGYVDGITNIILKNLKELDISKRPLHCSDSKREVLYIKDKDEWCKENDDKERLKLAIKHIAHKNIKMIPEWKRENPNYKLDEGKANDNYLKIVMQSMGGSDKQEDSVFQNKIISKIAKNVAIDKNS